MWTGPEKYTLASGLELGYSVYTVPAAGSGIWGLYLWGLGLGYSVYTVPMEVNLCHRVLKIKTHWIISTEYLCIEITYLNFLPLNLTLYIFNLSYSPLFFNVKKFNVKKFNVKIFNSNIFNVPKFSPPKSPSKFNVRNSVLTSGDPRKSNRS